MRAKPASRFGMNEPAAGPVARASHRLNLAVGMVVTLLPGLWTLMWNLVVCLLDWLRCQHLPFPTAVRSRVDCVPTGRRSTSAYTTHARLAGGIRVRCLMSAACILSCPALLLTPACVCAGVHVPLPRPCGDADDALDAKPRKHAMGRTDVPDLDPSSAPGPCSISPHTNWCLITRVPVSIAAMVAIAGFQHPCRSCGWRIALRLRSPAGAGRGHG